MPQQQPPTSTPNDNEAYRFPVSIKGVVIIDSQVALLKNPRHEWELPGGKLELGETPPVCLAREVQEELSLSVKVGPILDSWVYHIAEGVDVLIVTYGCYSESSVKPVHSAEHQALGLFSADEVDQLNMPQGYKDSVKEWFRRLAW
ncbi:MAG TPA: NUDIX domain-containing protein [Dehalococcoidia bacterium]|jgi:8-oxo-dGTP pyrophosphatase MutT (NUDIX family)|nr:NUDIX domain-containing protein [Dehalococcoidia bacterium]